MFWNPTNPHNKYKAPRRFRERFERTVEPGMDEEAIDAVAGWGPCVEYLAGEINLTKEEMDVVESRYDAEVAYLDHRVGQLVTFLKEHGMFDDTIIVFTSDHGENFGRYNRLLYHAVAVNEGLLRVPLVVTGVEADGTEDSVSTIDLLN
ncbi:MAG: sulfatase-like hydrolase/transferase, partial [Candidatus Nanohaloarchaea archaeon]|nr:sulfatase-like hydrolase/transferase [Candidatus Nanohaloarchaea archaeon]